MKKIKTVILGLVSLFALSGCNLENDDTKTNKIIDSIIECLDNKDSASFKVLFSEYAITQDTNIDNEIESLFSYYEGTKVKLYKWGKTISTHLDYGKEYKNYDCSYDITTTTEVYKMAVSIYTKNDFDKTKIGIESFYLLKEKDDPNKDMAYHGDGLWTVGCHIGKVMVTENEDESL